MSADITDTRKAVNEKRRAVVIEHFETETAQEFDSANLLTQIGHEDLLNAPITSFKP